MDGHQSTHPEFSPPATSPFSAPNEHGADARPQAARSPPGILTHGDEQCDASQPARAVTHQPPTAAASPTHTAPPLAASSSQDFVVTCSSSCCRYCRAITRLLCWLLLHLHLLTTFPLAADGDLQHLFGLEPFAGSYTRSMELSLRRRCGECASHRFAERHSPSMAQRNLEGSR